MRLENKAPSALRQGIYAGFCGALIFFTVSLGQEASTGPAWTARGYIPSDARREGEVRLWVQPESERMDVLLYTRSMGRAFRSIEQEEQSRYPEGHELHTASAQYLKSLREFRDFLREQQDAAEGRPPIQARLCFEWFPDFGSVRMESVDYTVQEGEYHVQAARTYRELILPSEYLLDHIRWMTQEQFPEFTQAGE